MQPPDEQLNIYRVLVENSLGLMCVHDLDGFLLSVNPAVRRSLQASDEHLPATFGEQISNAAEACCRVASCFGTSPWMDEDEWESWVDPFFW